MEKVSRIIIVDDDIKWLEYLAQIVEAYFSCAVENCLNFGEANDTIYAEASFDLLITDIYLSPKSRDAISLELAKFTTKIKRLPVIIITEEPSAIRPASKTFNIRNVFDKIDFDKLAFIERVRKAKI